MEEIKVYMLLTLWNLIDFVVAVVAAVVDDDDDDDVVLLLTI